MSDRFKGCVVTFDADFREEDCRAILDSIRLIRGVAGVDMHATDVFDDYFARHRVQSEFRGKFLALYEDLLGVKR